jgi:hypothetical protein
MLGNRQIHHDVIHLETEKFTMISDIIITVVVEGAACQHLRSKCQLAFHSRSLIVSLTTHGNGQVHHGVIDLETDKFTMVS